MESENESRPLLHSFQGETWRSSMRKRCMRIPSEVTITGMILGIFLVVVTLLIVFENMESTDKNELTLSDNLLASPFKYNKKALDETWQDKKESMKPTKNYKDQMWNKVDKGWKKVYASPGLFNKDKIEDLNEDYNNEFLNTFEPLGIDEYGKEVDDSFETFLEKEWSIANSMTNLDKDEETTRMKWKKVNDGWKKLSKEGWKDKEIKDALIKDLQEKDALKEQGSLLQSSMSLDGIWDKIDENWKKNMNKGDKVRDKQKKTNDDWKNKFNIKEDKEQEKQKKINDEWKDKINGLQSSTPGKEDEGFKSILDQGDKMRDKQKKINDDWKNKFNIKENKEQEKKKKINDEWKDKINNLQSSTSGKEDEGFKSILDQGWKNKEIQEALIEAGKKKENVLQSPINMNSLFGKTVDMLKNLIDEGKGKENSQKSINDDWKKKMSILQSPQPSKTLKDDKGLQKLSEQGWKKSDVKEALVTALKEKLNISASPMNFENFMDDVIESINNLQKDQNGIKEQKNNDGTLDAGPHLQSSMPVNGMDWKTSDDGWKKLTDQGWKDKEIRDALSKAWKDGKLMQSAMGYNSMKWKKVNNGWKKISNKSVSMPTRCPIFKTHQQHLLGSAMPAPPVDCALIAEDARRKLGKCIDLSFLPKSCKPSWRIKCFSSYKYRKIDGTCNNQIHPTWGQSGTPFVRMIAPDYADGTATLRTAKNGGPLPNPRFLSRTLYSTQMKQDSSVSVLFLYFGLIVDHDMVETAVNSNAIPCCDEDFQQNPENRPRECLQIDVPSDDPFYGPRNVTCLNLVRSVPVNGECAGRREQLNKATSFIDGSAIYGSAIKQAKQLRAFSTGQLRTQLINNTPFMAADETAGYSCGTPNEPLKCFKAGDSRVNMMVELTAMHTLWHREHNRIATELHQLNPKWTDEILFQETRRIIIGELQHITYKEFLPLLLGEKAMNRYELKVDESLNYEGYDDTIDPSVFNVFAAAAFRFGHSLVPDMQYLLGSDNSTQRKVPLHETFFNANILYHNGLDLLLRGAASQRTHTVDSYITPEVRDHLFQPTDLDYGHDLAAVGIQRGRDHGLPPYTKWRSVCGLSEVSNWDDLYKIMDKERADTFKNVYQSVEDIDLIPGALAEHHEEESLVGPTYTCLIGRQFKKTRKGDRFWFEILNEIGSFTKDQLSQIYKSNMARIVCDNSDDIKKIQKNPFEVPSAGNPILDCNAIPKVDLSSWKSTI